MIDKIEALIKQKLSLDDFLLDMENRAGKLEPIIHTEYYFFEKWLKKIVIDIDNKENISALNFGLFQSENSITMYISGSNNWSKDEEDWACNDDFSFKDKYIQLNVFEKLKEKLILNSDECLYLALTISITFITNFFKKNCVERETPFYVATGFDDGDLFNIGKLVNRELINI